MSHRIETSKEVRAAVIGTVGIIISAFLAASGVVISAYLGSHAVSPTVNISTLQPRASDPPQALPSSWPSTPLVSGSARSPQPQTVGPNPGPSTLSPTSTPTTVAMLRLATHIDASTINGFYTAPLKLVWQSSVTLNKRFVWKGCHIHWILYRRSIFECQTTTACSGTFSPFKPSLLAGIYRLEGRATLSSGQRVHETISIPVERAALFHAGSLEDGIEGRG